MNRGIWARHRLRRNEAMLREKTEEYPHRLVVEGSVRPEGFAGDFLRVATTYGVVWAFKDRETMRRFLAYRAKY